MENVIILVLLISTIVVFLLIVVYLINKPQYKQSRCSLRKLYPQNLRNQYIDNTKEQQNTLLDLTTDTRSRGLIPTQPCAAAVKSMWKSIKTQPESDYLDRVQSNVSSDTVTPLRVNVGQKICECKCSSGSDIIGKTLFD